MAAEPISIATVATVRAITGEMDQRLQRSGREVHGAGERQCEDVPLARWTKREMGMSTRCSLHLRRETLVQDVGCILVGAKTDLKERAKNHERETWDPTRTLCARWDVAVSNLRVPMWMSRQRRVHSVSLKARNM